MGLYNQLKTVNGIKLTISTIKRSTSIPIYLDSGDYLIDMHQRSTSKYESYVYTGWGFKTFSKPALIILYAKSDIDDTRSIDEFHDLVKRALNNTRSIKFSQEEVEDNFEALGLVTYSVDLRQLSYGFRKVHFIMLSQRK